MGTNNLPVISDVSNTFIDLVVHFECGGDIRKYLSAYKDAGGVPTIGIGTTRYPDGSFVKMGDTGTIDQVYTWFQHDLADVTQKVKSIIRADVTQGMFDALVDFAYNLGENALMYSTLLKVVNLNPIDYEAIETEFLKWVYSMDAQTHQKVIMAGLVRRRKSEVYLYQNGVNLPGFGV
jgi:lysozyme